MFDLTPLLAVLKPHFPFHRSRLCCLAAFVLALVKTRTVNLASLATALNPRALPLSNERRLSRFLSGFDLPQDTLARFVLALVPDAPLRLCLDRTTWFFGQTPINLLVLAVAYHKMAVPLLWTNLDKPGNSNTDERVALLERLFKLLEPERVASLTADREFVGVEWLGFLKAKPLSFVSFVLRVKRDFRVKYRGQERQAAEWFKDLKVGEERKLENSRGRARSWASGSTSSG